MILTGRLVLPPTVEMIPARTLPAATRALFTHGENDFVLARTHARDFTRVVNAPTAELLSCFRVARTVADAVIAYSRTASADPETVLANAWPLITQLVNDRLLVAVADGADGADGADTAESGTNGDPASRLIPGARIESWTVVDRVQVLEDTAVYQVTDGAGRWYALKVARGRGESGFARWIEHEGDVLAELNGVASPRLRARGEIAGSPYVVMDWCDGSGIEAVAAEMRALPRDGRRTALLDLAVALLNAYAQLHARGVVHADVHHRNVLADRDGRVTVLDFALARRTGGQDDHIPRAGVAFYFEPEFVKASLDGTPRPFATEAGEQYAVAALLYLLFTGEHYQDFKLERHAFRQQVLEGAALPFAARGVESWPEVESALAKALSKEAGDRYPSAEAFADRLKEIRRAVPAAPQSGGEPAPAYVPDDAQRMLLGAFLVRAGAGASAAPAPVSRPPTVSVMHGAAGLAYVLYRLALVREDAEMLALADLWSMRAIAGATASDAFADVSRGLTARSHSPATPYHTLAGVHCVRGLIANAAGDHHAVFESVEAFISGSSVPADGANPDLMLGDSGVLVASALLLNALSPVHEGARVRLAEHGATVLQAIDRAVAAMPAMPACAGFTVTGAAHGWAGVLFAMLRWCEAEGRPATAETIRRLAELAGHGEPWGRGMRWPHSLDPRLPERRTYLPGWCNGSAGFVHLWTVAASVTGDATYDELAERSAWSTWEQASDTLATICCGLAGMSYALLRRDRAAPGRGWFARAAALASRAARVAAADPLPYPDSLYHGSARRRVAGRRSRAAAGRWDAVLRRRRLAGGRTVLGIADDLGADDPGADAGVWPVTSCVKRGLSRSDANAGSIRIHAGDR